MKKSVKKVLSLMLCLVMLMSVFCVNAMAKGGGGGGYQPSTPPAKYNHIDVRVAGTLTIQTKVNGEVTSTETFNVTISNVSATLNGKDVGTFTRKNGSGDENEWHKEGLSLDPTKDTVVVTCTATAIKDGTSINFPITVTYTGSETLNAFIQECPGNSGYDIDISVEDVTESFTRDITVTKVWNDNKNNDQTRPDSVTIQLYADGVAEGSPVTVNAASDWSVQFTDLPKYSSGTTEIVYTVAEVNVPTNYTASVTGDVENGFTITNTLDNIVPTVGSLTITKEFAGLPEGTTPKSVSFTVTGPNDYSGSVILSENNGWEFTLSNLAPGSYSVVEDVASAKVNGYVLTATAVNGNSAEVKAGETATIAFTNTYRAQPSFSFFISKVVEQSGNVDPGEQTFAFELVDVDGGVYPPEYYGVNIGDITISTDGAGRFSTKVNGTVDPDELPKWTQHEGDNSNPDTYYYCTFILKENNGGADGWTYSDEQYTIEIRYYSNYKDDEYVEEVIVCVDDMNGRSQNEASFTNTYSATSTPESTPIRDTVTIEIGNNDKPEETNPDTGAPVMFVPVIVAALAGAVVVRRKK